MDRSALPRPHAAHGSKRWKQCASGLADAIGISYKSRISMRLHEVLGLPLASVPSFCKQAREQIEAEIAGKSYRQLFLQLKQSEDGINSKRGRLKGEGGASAEARALSRQRQRELELTADSDFLKRLGELMGKAVDVRFTDPELEADLAALLVPAECLVQFVKRTLKDRATNGRKP